jgi:endonuclease/exonuclease/phosphatase family metal-dependent hydrolase
MAEPKKKSGRFSFLRFLLMVANLFVILGVIAGFMAAYISPDKNWIWAFFGLAFPYLLIINLFFIPIWLLFKKKYALLPLVVILICWPRISGYIQLDFGKKSVAEEPEIRVMSYNVKLFDLYNWNKSHASSSATKMFELMGANKPDLLFIQEYHAGRKGKINIADSIEKYTKLKYSFISLVENNGKVRPYGIATFSRWPIVSKGIIKFSGNPANICSYADIIRDGDTIRAFNIHLESIQFSKEDYLYVSEFRTNAEEQELLSEGIRSIARKLKRAFIQRASQARVVAEEIERSPFPVIVCGDLNDTPSSYTYYTISDQLNDAFVTSGNGLSQTYAGVLPSFRIDYIMYDKSGFSASDYSRIRNKLSDHYPVSATLRLKSVE